MNAPPTLPKQCCEHLNNVLSITGPALQFCDRCEKAGLDMTQYRSQFQQMQDTAKKLKAEFFHTEP